MASETTLEFETLLSPISEDSPTGVELRDSEDMAEKNLFYELRDARTTSSDAERKQATYLAASEKDRETMDEPPSPDWRRVRDLSLKALGGITKDIWITAWLTEALCRLEGFAGLRDGFRLTREFAEAFWDGIHPAPDEEDGIASTVSQLDGLNNALPLAIDQIPITPPTSSFNSFTSADYKDGKALDGASPEYRAERVENGAATMEMIQRAAKEAGGPHFEQLLEDIEQCIQEFDQLNSVLDSKCGLNEDGYSAAPMSSAISKALEECQGRVKYLARDFLPVEEAETNEEAAGTELVAAAGQNGAATNIANTAVQTREDAFRALLKVSEFFRRSEPHSPVSYALEQAVRWGRMSLPELMKDLISDSGVREELFKRTGIPELEDKDDDDED